MDEMCSWLTERMINMHMDKSLRKQVVIRYFCINVQYIEYSYIKDLKVTLRAILFFMFCFYIDLGGTV